MIVLEGGYNENSLFKGNLALLENLLGNYFDVNFKSLLIHPFKI